MSRSIKLLLAVTIVFGSAALAAPSYISDGLMTWERGAPGSTWQDWTFGTGQNPATPEDYYNPYGTPDATFTGTDTPAGQPYSVEFGWESEWRNRDGVWAGDTLAADFYVPNSGGTDLPKIIWFEMEYQAALVTMDPEVIVAGDYDVSRFHYEIISDYDDDWRTMVIGWRVNPAPYEENIEFELWGTGGFVSSVSIDTIVVPAPAALPLAGIGLILVQHLKRKKCL